MEYFGILGFEVLYHLHCAPWLSHHELPLLPLSLHDTPLWGSDIIVFSGLVRAQKDRRQASALLSSMNPLTAQADWKGWGVFWEILKAPKSSLKASLPRARTLTEHWNSHWNSQSLPSSHPSLHSITE